MLSFIFHFLLYLFLLYNVSCCLSFLFVSVYILIACVSVRTFVYVCTRVYEYACVCTRVHVRVRVHVCVRV